MLKSITVIGVLEEFDRGIFRIEFARKYVKMSVLKPDHILTGMKESLKWGIVSTIFRGHSEREWQTISTVV